MFERKLLEPDAVSCDAVSAYVTNIGWCKLSVFALILLCSAVLRLPDDDHTRSELLSVQDFYAAPFHRQDHDICLQVAAIISKEDWDSLASLFRLSAFLVFFLSRPVRISCHASSCLRKGLSRTGGWLFFVPSIAPEFLGPNRDLLVTSSVTCVIGSSFKHTFHCPRAILQWITLMKCSVKACAGSQIMRRM